jgi:hypothetical protein
MTPMARTIYIHIGAHKTGTSAAQGFFKNNRASLAKRGVLFPESCTYLAAQHRLAFALKDAKRRQALGNLDFPGEMRSLEQEIQASDCHTVIVSSEEFFSVAAERTVVLREALRDDDVKIVAVLRRPDHLFESIYNQRAKGTTNGFTRHYGGFLAEPGRLSADMRFDTALKNWEFGFGREAIVARCYEEADNVIALLADAMGLDIDGLETTQNRRNESVSVRAAELIRQGKLLGLDEKILNQLAQIGRLAFPKAAESGALLSPDERMALLAKTDTMTGTVFDRYFGSPNIYASQRFSVEEFPEKAELSLADTVRIMAEIIE